MNLKVYKNNRVEDISLSEVVRFDIDKKHNIYYIKVTTEKEECILYQDYTNKPIESNNELLIKELVSDLNFMNNRYHDIINKVDPIFSECYMLNLECFLLKEKEIE